MAKKRSIEESENKVGVISFIRNTNFGSNLQVYALYSYLRKLKYTPHYFVVNNTNKLAKMISRLCKAIYLLYCFVTNPSTLSVYRRLKKHVSELPQPSNIMTQKCHDFIDNNIKYEISSIHKLYFKSRSNDYFAFICGSDQVWSPLRILSFRHFYLNFAPDSKKIAYAPSFGVNNYPSYNIKRVKKYIRRFQHLSIREKSGQKILKSDFQRDAEVVLDPTLLVGREFWEEEIKDIALDADNYILCYFLKEPSQEQIQIIKRIKTKLDCSVIMIPYKFEIPQIDAKYLDCSPLEFVHLVKKAKFVCTNSFHGSAFSVICNTPFIALERYTEKAMVQKSRISDFLKELGLEGRHITDNELETIEIDEILVCDYKEVNVRLDKWRAVSSNYLEEALLSVKK